jgi:hypothetical protein
MNSVAAFQRSVLRLCRPVVFVSLTSCGDTGVSDEGFESHVSVARAALNGKLNGTFNCDATEGRLALDGLELARDHVAGTKAQQMLACLKDVTFSSSMRTGTDHAKALRVSPESILRAMAEPLPTHVTCADLPAQIDGRASMGEQGKEDISLDHAFLASASVQQVASVVLHEVAHTKGFRHPDNVGSPPEYAFTVPEQLEACSLRISAGTATYQIGTETRVVPHAVARGNPDAYSIRHVELAPVGSIALGEQQNEYPPDVCVAPWVPGQSPTFLFFPSFARGLYGQFTGEQLQGIGLKCRVKDDAGAQSQTPLRAGNAQSSEPSFSLDCPAGELLVGVRGYTKRLSSMKGNVGLSSGDVITALAPRCAPLSDIQTKTADYSRGTLVGPRRAGMVFDRGCPPGMAVKGLGAAANDQGVSQLRVLCQGIDEWDLLLTSEAPTIGWPGGAVEMCPHSGAVYQLFGQGDGDISWLGGLCGIVAKDPATGERRRIFGLGARAAVLTGFGQLYVKDYKHPSWDTQNACSGNEVMVGLAANFSNNHRGWSHITGLRAVCAKVKDRATGSTATRLDDPVGDSRAPDVISECPQSQAVAGWRIRAYDTIWGITPLCRYL